MNKEKRDADKFYKAIKSTFIYLPDFIIRSNDGKMFIRKNHQVYRDPDSFTEGILHTFDISNENENFWVEMNILLTEKEHNKIFKK